MQDDAGTPFSDFIALDDAAKALLVQFYEWLQSDRGLTPEDASPLAHAADRYLRDFVVDIMAQPPKGTCAALARAYLGNWYIVNTLTPTTDEVELIAKAMTQFHTFCGINGTIDPAIAEEAASVTADPAPFKVRLEQFWALTPETIEEWRSIDDYRKGAYGNGATH